MVLNKGMSNTETLRELLRKWNRVRLEQRHLEVDAVFFQGRIPVDEIDSFSWKSLRTFVRIVLISDVFMYAVESLIFKTWVHFLLEFLLIFTTGLVLSLGRWIVIRFQGQEYRNWIYAKDFELDEIRSGILKERN